MATEIFIEPELENLENGDTAAEWFELCSRLGLQGQLSTADKSEDKKAPPYMFIDPKTERIITTLCPRGVDYKKYTASTIPLDILQEIAKCEKNGWYDQIKIHYDDKSPDPFVIGFKKEPQSTWLANKHLIARWGAELLPFEQLEVKAINRLREDAKEALADIRAKIDFASNNVDAFIRGVLNGKQNPQLNFNADTLGGFW